MRACTVAEGCREWGPMIPELAASANQSSNCSGQSRLVAVGQPQPLTDADLAAAVAVLLLVAGLLLDWRPHLRMADNRSTELAATPAGRNSCLGRALRRRRRHLVLPRRGELAAAAA